MKRIQIREKFFKAKRAHPWLTLEMERKYCPWYYISMSSNQREGERGDMGEYKGGILDNLWLLVIYSKPSTVELILRRNWSRREIYSPWF